MGSSHPQFLIILYSFLFFSKDISPTFNYTCRHKFNAYYSQGSRFNKYVNWEEEALKHRPESIHKERSKLPNELVSTVCRTLKLLYADILILCIYLWSLKLNYGWTSDKYNFLARIKIQSLLGGREYPYKNKTSQLKIS